MTFRPQQKITDKAALERVERMVARIRHAATRLPDGPGERDERVRRGGEDFFFFAPTYFPHHFTKDPAECHYEMIEAWQEPGVNVDRLPRGFAKTTVGQLFTLWCLLYDKRKFAVIIGKSGETAQEIVLTIILELEENERLRQDFGDQRTQWWSADGGYRLKSTGNWLLGIGRKEPMRGRKKVQQRPDLVLADDIEDEELVRNPKRVKDLLKWWLQSVLPSMAHGGTAVWLCTSLSQKSASSLLMDPEWVYDDAEEPPQCRRFSYKALNDDGESTWPGQWSVERLLAKRAQIGSTAFNAEYLHKPEPVGGLFRSEWFRYYDGVLPAGCVTVIAIDPSAKAKETSDCKAVVAVAKNLRTEDYFVQHARIQKESITAMCVAVCDLYEFLLKEAAPPKYIMIEVNGFQELVKTELLRIATKRRLRLPMVPIENHVAKEVRIQTLQPLAENGQLHFIKRHSDQDILTEQLIYFPSSSVNDDGPDALEMGIAKLLPFRADRKPGKYERVGERRMDVREIL